MSNKGIYSEKEDITLLSAKQIILKNISFLSPKSVCISDAFGHVLSKSCTAVVDSPSVNAALKDGFAVCGLDIQKANETKNVKLVVVGKNAAGFCKILKCSNLGSTFNGTLTLGQAVAVTTGAALPNGADTVVPREFCKQSEGQNIEVFKSVNIGDNVLLRGSDNKTGDVIAQHGELLTPGLLGLLASAGQSTLSVVNKPKVALLSSGDEVVALGNSLHEGQLFASNLIMLGGWLSLFDISYDTVIVSDDKQKLNEEIKKLTSNYDAVVTIGGIGGSDRDFVISILDEIGFNQLFRGVQMSPGKGSSFGFCKNTPVFCVPGGPSACEISFLQLALPGILRLAGRTKELFTTVNAIAKTQIRGRHLNWSEFKYCLLEKQDEKYFLNYKKDKSRIKSIASANCILCMDKGVLSVEKGKIVQVQIHNFLSG